MLHRLHERRIIGVVVRVGENTVTAKGHHAATDSVSQSWQGFVDFDDPVRREHTWLTVVARIVLEAHVDSGFRHARQLGQPDQLQMMILPILKQCILRYLYLIIHTIVAFLLLRCKGMVFFLFHQIF